MQCNILFVHCNIMPLVSEVKRAPEAQTVSNRTRERYRLADSLKEIDPKWPITEADITLIYRTTANCG